MKTQCFSFLFFLFLLFFSCEKKPTPPVVRNIPGRITILTATARNTAVFLQWSVPNDNGYPITSYKIYRDTSATYLTLLTSITDTNYLDTGLTNGTTYYYQVSAVNSKGEGGKSDAVECTPNPQVPNQVTNLTVASGNAQALLRWAVPDDNGSPITSFKVYRGASSSLLPFLTSVADVIYLEALFGRFIQRIPTK